MRTIDEYISTFPENVQILMQRLRATILRNAPEAVESISWGMPTFKTHGKPLVYFAGHKHHIGFYGMPTVHTEFVNELKGYKQGKGSVQFPIDKPLPVSLIGRMVAFRVRENSEKHKSKK